MTTFAAANRVVFNTNDQYDGNTGTIVEAVDGGYVVNVDGGTGRLWFNSREVKRIGTGRRLVIKPTDATTRAVFDGRTDLAADPSLISADEVIIEGDFEFEVTDEVIIEGDFEFEVEDLDPNVYVRVQFVKYGTQYTYIDPTDGELLLGDEVEVPVTYGTKVGTVVAHGRDSYTGPCKIVQARIKREAL